MIKSAVFDMGGTLMEYKGMPCVWVDYYENGFLHVCEKLLPQLTEKNIADGMEILRGYNPSIKFREADYSYERIFGEIVRKWGVNIPPEEVAYCFFEAFPLKAYTYPETVPVLQKLRDRGIKIATLTDVATGMPDELHKSYFPELMPYFDLYVSSLSCGWRKPNVGGLKVIEQRFGAEMSGFVFVGDEEKDIKTAKNAHCTSVLIDRKNRSCDFGQDYTIHTLDELFAVI